MISELLFDNRDQTLQLPHDLLHEIGFEPIKVLAPLDLVPHQVQIPEHPQYLGHSGNMQTQDARDLFRGSLLIPKQSQHFISGWITQRTADP